MAHHPTFTALTLMACAGAASAQVPIITDIGVLPGGAVSTSRAISGNGHVVVGSCLLFGANRSISWRHGTQMLDLGLLPGQTSSEAHAANASGAVIVGADRAGSLFRAFRWTSPGPKQDLGFLPGQTTAEARGVSADGQVVVGTSGSRAFRWTSTGGMTDLGLIPGSVSASAFGVSADGSVVVGGGGQAFRWTAATGMVGLGFLPGGTQSNAVAVSGDGAVVVGTGTTPTGAHGFMWTEKLGMTDLGDRVNPLAVNEDGSVIVGSVAGVPFVFPFIWTPELGVVNFITYLEDRGTDLTGWTLSQAYGVSDDGTHVVGYGSFNGVTRGWIVNLDPDTDNDGLRDSWEIIGIPYKDANGKTRRYQLPGADPTRKNLYVEIDAMKGLGFSPDAIAMVEAAFQSAPVPNPQGPPGITLQIFVDELDLPYRQEWLSAPGTCWPADFDAVREVFYGTPSERADPDAQALLAAKAKAFRYCVVADRAGPTHWGGCGPKPGDNFVLYARKQQGIADRQASAFMHELGHNLGLTHGGNSGDNGKPNYPSIMNYVLAYKYTWARSFWRLDYSRAGAEEFLSLNENSLNEPIGIGAPGGQYTSYLMPFGINALENGATVRRHAYARLNGEPVDFGNTTGTGFQDHLFTAGVRQDLNYVTPAPPGVRLPSMPSPGDTLHPFNDWANIALPLAAALGDLAPIPTYPSDELTEEAIDWIDQNFPDPTPPCYANCDHSTTPPILNINDFICFQAEFAAASPYANCDGSTTPPLLNVNDFICFQINFAGGCP